MQYVNTCNLSTNVTMCQVFLMTEYVYTRGRVLTGCPGSACGKCIRVTSDPILNTYCK